MVGLSNLILDVLFSKPSLFVVVLVGGSVANDLGHARVKHLYLGAFSYLVMVGAYVQVMELSDGEIINIDAFNVVVGGKEHKRWDSKSDLVWLKF